MNSRNDDKRPAVAARRRGQARLRAATVSVGAAGLVTAGVVAFTLPGSTSTSSKAATGTSNSTSSNATAGGSGTTSNSTSGSNSVHASSTPSASSGSTQATSGGS